MAGVMMASPENRAAPITPSRNTAPPRRPSACWANAISESAALALVVGRIRKRTYLTVTVKIKA